MAEKPFGLVVPRYDGENGIGIKGPYLGDLVWDHMQAFERDDFEYIPVEYIDFADGSQKIVTQESVRNKELYIIHPKYLKPAEHVLTAQMIGDELSRSDANNICLFDVYNPYVSQDKRKDREPVTARIVANNYKSANINRVFMLDPHSEELVMAFSSECALEPLPMSSELAEYFRTNYELSDWTVSSPDVGGYKRAGLFSNLLGIPLVGVRKDRFAPDQSRPMEIIGDIRRYVKGKKILLRDDVLRTAGSVDNTTKLMLEAGAKEVKTVVTHFDPCGGAVDRIKKNDLKIITTNSIPNVPKEIANNVEVLDVSDVVAKVIRKRTKSESISGFFNQREKRVGEKNYRNSTNTG